MKRWIIVASILIVAAGTLFAVRHGQAKAELAPQTALVTRGNIVQEALAIGNVVPEQEIAVKSQVPGIVSRVYVAVGDMVSEGDPLCEIRPHPTPTERAEAQRNLQMAQVDEAAAAKKLERDQQLFDQGLLPERDLDTARQARDNAQLRAKLEGEKLQLLRDGRANLEGKEVSNRIVAPATGTILTLDVHPGDSVVPLTSYQAGTALLTMADMSHLIFRGTVDEVDVGKLATGLPVRFTVGAIPQADVNGSLRRISPKARKQDSATLFDIEAEITQSSGAVLRAGYSANARVVIAHADSVLVLPERVVKFADGKATVRIAGKNGKPEAKDITTGLSDGLTIEVTGGLALNDAVLEPDKSPLDRK
jgi:HlyD family secretion protein